MSQQEPKYIIDNGRVKKNPNYGGGDAAKQQKSTVLNPEKAITYASTIDDANEIANLSAEGQVAPSTQNVVVTMQDNQYLNQFGVTNNQQIDGGELLDQLSDVFSQLEAPIRLANKLIALQGYVINVKIDDSGSMNTRSLNGKTRWMIVYERVITFMKLLQFVPTNMVIVSFLNRRQKIFVNRFGSTPQAFFSKISSELEMVFRQNPSGGTPIYENVVSMLNVTRDRPTAHYLFTDGVPSSTNYSSADEIRYTKDTILKRSNPRQNPFTFMGCSDVIADTTWIMEVEEIACRPGCLGYVAALENFVEERLRVLNDQGPCFPYTEAMYILCGLTAAMNPNDLDALDQSSPIAKPTFDNLLGHVTTSIEYESYFHHHPDAEWLFAEDYPLFLTTEITSQIPSVNYYETYLAQQLNQDIDNDDDTSEPRAISQAEEALLNRFNRNRPSHLRQARKNFWLYNCLRMEQQQLNYSIQNRLVTQDVWMDYSLTTITAKKHFLASMTKRQI